MLFNDRIEGILEFEVPAGLTIGIDLGRIVRMRMLEQDEYVGRAMNVAARLQGAAGNGGHKACGRVLASMTAHHRLQLPGAGKTVTLNLKNLSQGNTYRARCLQLKNGAV